MVSTISAGIACCTFTPSLRLSLYTYIYIYVYIYTQDNFFHVYITYIFIYAYEYMYDIFFFPSNLCRHGLFTPPLPPVSCRCKRLRTNYPHRSRWKFPKVSLLVNLLYTMTVKLSLRNCVFTRIICRPM